MNRTAALLFAVFTSHLALADPVGPWLKVDLLPAIGDGEPMFGFSGPIYWSRSTQSETPPYQITWWLGDGVEEAAVILPPAQWPNGAYNGTSVTMVTDRGTAVGSGRIANETEFAWVQDGSFPFRTRRLGLNEPVHTGPAGEQVTRFHGDAAAGAVLGVTRRYNLSDPLNTNYDHWTWIEGQETLHPLTFTEGAYRLVAYWTAMEGRWVAMRADRRNDRGLKAFLVNAESGEQREIGLRDLDHVVDPGDEGFPNATPVQGWYAAFVQAIDDRGCALLNCRTYTPDGHGSDAWLYNWSDASYTRVAADVEAVYGRLHLSPSRQRFVVDGSGPIWAGSIEDAQVSRVRFVPPDQVEGSTISHALWWSGDEPLVVATTYTQPLEGAPYRWAPPFAWRPSTGPIPLSVPGYEEAVRVVGRSAASGRYTLLLGSHTTDGFVKMSYAVYDAAAERVMLLADFDLVPATAIPDSIQFVGDRLLAFYSLPAESKVLALLIDPQGATIDLSAQFTSSLADRRVMFEYGFESENTRRAGVVVLSEAGISLQAFVSVIDRCSAADISGQGVTDGPDQHLDNNDIIRFIDLFFSADPRADFAGVGAVPGADGAFDNNDLIVFIDAFFADCP